MAEENSTWYGSLGLADENIGVIQTKGWENADALISSYRELEKHIGADKNDFIKMPKVVEGETPDYSEVFARLGRPETADGYELADSEFSSAAKEVLFKAGITKSQAKDLESWITEYATSAQQKAEEARVAELDAKAKTAIESLKKEWGADFEKNQALAQDAVRKFGLSDEVIDAIGDAAGADVAAKLFLALATRSDTNSPLTGYRGGGDETREIAAMKLSEMRNDPEIIKKLAAGDQKVNDEFNRLAAIIAKRG
jgi:hypothetical protein